MNAGAGPAQVSGVTALRMDGRGGAQPLELSQATALDAGPVDDDDDPEPICTRVS